MSGEIARKACTRTILDLRDTEHIYSSQKCDLQPWSPEDLDGIATSAFQVQPLNTVYMPECEELQQTFYTF